MLNQDYNGILQSLSGLENRKSKVEIYFSGKTNTGDGYCLTVLNCFPRQYLLHLNRSLTW